MSDYVDVAKYGLMTSWEENDFGVRWEEPRDIYKVVIAYPDESSMPDVAEQQLQYWQNHWPHQRVPKGASIGAGSSGWMASDDSLERIAERLDRVRRIPLLAQPMISNLSLVDERSYRAGLFGSNESGLFKPKRKNR